LSTAVSDNTDNPVRGEERVAADYTLVTGAGIGSALLSFVSATLTTRVLAPEAFGALSLVLVTSLVLQMATSSWTSVAVTRFGREAIDRGLSLSAISRARLTIVGPWLLVSVGAILALKATGALPAQLTWPLVAVAVVHGVIAVAYEHCLNLLRALDRQRFAATGLLLQQLVLVSIIAVLLATGAHATPLTIGLLYAGGSLALLAVYVPTLWGPAFRHPVRDRAIEQLMWRFSAPLIGFTVASYVVGSIDLWVLGAFASPTAVGSYAAAYRSYTVLMTIAAAAAPVLMTLFVSLRLAGRGAEIAGFVRTTIPGLVLSAGALCAVLVAPAYALAPIVFSDAFRSASLPTAILLVGVVVYLECCLLGAVLTAHDRTAASARAITLAAVFNVASDLVAVGIFKAGIWAPALATVVSNLIMAVGYARAAGVCTNERVSLVLSAYVAPALAVVALVVASPGTRIWVSFAVGLVAAGATVALKRKEVLQPVLLRLRTRPAVH
jgi:O-antigen/teichoic acid export membrane protein